MDLEFTERHQAFRREVRDWLEQNVPAEPLESFDTEKGFEQHRQWERTLHEGRWSMVTWPEAYGGRGSDLIEWLIFEEEYWRAHAPTRVNQNGVFILGPTLMEFGTDEQKQHFLPRIASGEDIWAQGWSEPNAGSDMAAVRATAIRDGREYVINGHKIWSSRAAWADWLFGLFRTSPQSRRHRGLSFLLVPLDAPGVTVRPIRQLDGNTGFAEIFFDDVRVPMDHRVGAEGAGWQVAMATAGFERGVLLRSPARFEETLRALIELYRSRREEADRDPGLRDAVARAWMSTQAYTLATYGTASRQAKGDTIAYEASSNKVYWSELDRDMHETAMRLLGARAGVISGLPGSGDSRRWLEGFLFSLAGPIYAGTNEIQRNIIGERMLGLPRS